LGDRDGDSEIFAMNADGSAQTQLTFNSAFDAHPAWSPDGTKIAFSSTRDGDFEVLVMNADGSGQTQLTFNSADDALPNWSPEGTKIAFSSSRNGDDEIFVMNADGSTQTQLTSNDAHDFDPAWSPDGTKIAFVSLRSPFNDDIFVMNVDGTGEQQLTSSPDDDFLPDWQPLENPVTLTNDLIADVEALGLPQGIEQSLVAKLNDVLAALAAVDLAGACAALDDFIAEVNAQTQPPAQKKLTQEQAAAVLAAAGNLHDVFGCP
jgi:Tol biopolymer transport system component